VEGIRPVSSCISPSKTIHAWSGILVYSALFRHGRNSGAFFTAAAAGWQIEMAKKPYRTTLAIFVYPCIVACVSYYGQMNKLWPKTWPKPKTMNAKTQALAE